MKNFDPVGEVLTEAEQLIDLTLAEIQIGAVFRRNAMVAFEEAAAHAFDDRGGAPHKSALTALMRYAERFGLFDAGIGADKLRRIVRLVAERERARRREAA